MINFIKKNLALLEHREKIEFLKNFALMAAASSIEVLGIVSVLPFMAVLTDPQIIFEQAILKTIYEYFNFQTVNSFLIFLGGMVLLILIIGNTMKAAMTWRNLNFCYMQNFRLSKRLFQLYLGKPYHYFLQANSADILSHILTEVSHYINGILMSVLQLISGVLTVCLIVALLMVLNPWVVLGTLCILALSYLVIYKCVQQKLDQIGKSRYSHSMNRYKAINEAIHGVKQIKLQGKEDIYLSRYGYAALNYSRALTRQGVISQIPRYAMEIIIFGLVIGLILFLLSSDKKIDTLLPFIVVYVFAGYRLMPALQQIFAASTSIKFHKDTLDTHFNMVEKSASTELQKTKVYKDVLPVVLEKQIELKNINFKYEGANSTALEDFNIEIKAGSVIGLAGTTGAGKSTIIDILIGLLSPSSGKLIVDEDEINSKNLAGWKKTIGYVSQSIYLSDASVAENIAFGVPVDQIDMRRVREVAKLAEIHDFVTMELPEKYETIIGENAVRISGGQKQRIGLARALYINPSVLILDEATSALDNLTEEKVLASVYALSSKMTIIMIAHRLNTLSSCDKIYLLEKGEIIAEGAYDELLKDSPEFIQMVQPKSKL